MRAARSRRARPYTSALSVALAILVTVAGAISGPVSPVRAIDPSRVLVAVAAGYSHTVGLRSDGTVEAVGNNEDGQCDVSGWSDIAAVTAGGFHTVGLRSDGTVEAVGNNEDGQCDVSGWSGITAVAAGGGHTVGLRADGTLVAVGGWADDSVSGWAEITSIAAGGQSAIGLKGDGTVSVLNGEALDWTDIIAVATSGSHFVGLRSDGSVVAEGENDSGQIEVAGWTDIIAVAAGPECTLGLKSDGTVVAVGNDSQGRPCDVSHWNSVTAVAAGYGRIHGVRSDGAVYGSPDGIRRTYASGSWSTKRVSVDPAGGRLEGFEPAISADGRYVAFTSADPESNDVKVFDRNTGQVSLASVASDGTRGNGSSRAPAISADGRYVAFLSYATNLDSPDASDRADVYIHDRVTGKTTRASGTGHMGEVRACSLSADGRYVAYSTFSATEGSRPEWGLYNFYVRDWQAGVFVWAGAPATGDMQSRAGAFALSGNGQVLVFESEAPNSLPGDQHSGLGLFVCDISRGSVSRLAVYPEDALEDFDSFQPSISADGRYVAFRSENLGILPSDAREFDQVFVHDVVTGETTWVSTATGGQAIYGDPHPDMEEPWEGVGAGGPIGHPSISTDGRYVAFESRAHNLVPADEYAQIDVYVHDRISGTTRVVSMADDGTLGDRHSRSPSISSDGSTIAFKTGALNLVEGETPAASDWISDVFVHEWWIDPPGTTVAGPSRYDTAVAASKAAYPSGLDPTGARTVVIATGRNWPDALGGTALAGALDGPILLTETDTVPDAVMAEISRLKATKAIVLGGPDVVSAQVISALASRLGAGNVERIAGTSRYETANAVAARVKSVLGAAYDGTAFVATGAKFPDALAAAPLAAAKGWPLYLAHPSSGPSAATKSAMSGTTRALILGGTDVVSPETESSLKAGLGASNVTRLAGTSRYDTAVKVAEYGVANAGLSWNGVGITTGQKFPDALAGGVLQAKTGSVMLLTRSENLEAATAKALSDHKAAISGVTIYGSTGAVSRGVRTAVAQALQ